MSRRIGRGIWEFGLGCKVAAEATKEIDAFDALIACSRFLGWHSGVRFTILPGLFFGGDLRCPTWFPFAAL